MRAILNCPLAEQYFKLLSNHQTCFPGPLSSRLRQRGNHESSKIRELDRGQIVFFFSVEGMVTLELAFLATRDAVPSPPYRACYLSL